MKQILFSILSISSFISFSQTDITFPSEDGLTITAKLYEVKGSNNIMLLCHQARFSKGEYKETAPKFNKLGYTCLAIDQRSGDSINGDINETAKLAKQKN